MHKQAFRPLCWHSKYGNKTALTTAIICKDTIYTLIGLNIHVEAGFLGRFYCFDGITQFGNAQPALTERHLDFSMQSIPLWCLIHLGVVLKY